MENEILYGVPFPVSSEVLGDDFVLPIGKAKIELEGNDVTIVSFSKGVQNALEAAEELKSLRINVEVSLIEILKFLGD